MGAKKRAAIQASMIFLICMLVILHAIHWHSTGMYLEMFSWLKTGKGYLTVIYNLSLVLTLGAVLGFLMEKIAELITLTIETPHNNNPTIHY